MVDIGRGEEVDTVIAGLPADDRAEIAKTLIPGYATAMAEQGPAADQRALDYRDALFSLRQSVPAEDQEADRRRAAARAGERTSRRASCARAGTRWTRC